MSPYKALITKQNQIGWDHFVCGKLTKEWRLDQYHFAKRYGVVKQSKGWTVDLVKIMVNLSFQLWELRNTCRHGHDDASKQQSIYGQTHREVRCLYLLQPMVLQQVCTIFRDTVEEHLLAAVPQLRSWIVHNRKLIQHSVKVAKAQSKLQTHQIQQFFPCRGTTQSTTVPLAQRPAPRCHRITCISNLFQAVVRPRNTIRTLPAIEKTSVTTLNGLQRRIIHRRQLNLYPTCFQTILASSQSVPKLHNYPLTAARQFRWVYSLSAEAYEIAIKQQCIYLFHDQYKYTYFWRAGGLPPALSFYIFHH
jgi:hypothetical protein